MAKALDLARTKMEQAGLDAVAIEVFTYYFALLESGETGMVPEATIDPLEMESLADVDVDEATGREALSHTAVIKLNGGLGTSMGLDRAKSLLQVRDGLTFLDIAVRQVLSLRERHGVKLPLLFMNSFRTSADTMAALAKYPDLAVDGLPLEFIQNKIPKLLTEGLDPVEWPADPDLEWCPPGHGDLYTALWGTGLLDRLAEAGYERVFVSNSDNLGATADPRVAGWFAQSGAPFAIEAVLRTPSDRKGGHFARRKSDGRIVLRETAQTLPEDLETLADLERHRFSSTNNLWFDVPAMRAELRRRHGVLGLAMIKNVKTVDPTDPVSPEVVQLETAMGAAIEIFDGATTIEVGRDRFIPVKTTNDLLVVRSDCYHLDEDGVLRQAREHIPFVDLDSAYKLVADFDARFPEGVPSLRHATSVRVRGDWAFEGGVRCEGEVELGPEGAPGHIPAGTTLTGAVAE